MQIVIYASGIPFNGDTIKTQALGGSESAAYYVAKELADRGHRVSVFTESQEQGTFDGVQYLWVGQKGNAKPMGQNWHFYCENTPHDVNIIQRVPYGFSFAIQSKINLWWAHDIALKRNNDAFMSQLWQTTKVMPVSHWFKEQISNAWMVDPNIIEPIHNGVDYSLFNQFELKDNAKAPEEVTMIYCSRPERGLENLVMPGMIMDQLQEKAPNVRLKVCGYEHTVPDMQGYYDMLRDQVDALPNCEHIGALPKDELYRYMCEEADVWCYPTQFEEVSCITAMECMAAGLSIFTTPTAALPETIGDYENCVMIPNTDDGCDVDRFVERLASFNNKFRRRPRRDYSWKRATDEIEAVIEDCFADATQNVDSLARHYLRYSDITALRDLMAGAGRENAADGLSGGQNVISKEVLRELPLYDWQDDPEDYANHYADGTEEMYDGPDFRYEEGFEHHPRYQGVARSLDSLPDGSTVIDYGCAHGHFTNNFGKEFPNLNFVGIDVSPKAIQVAWAKAREWELDNVEFCQDDWLGRTCQPMQCDAVVLGEILEHVPDPVVFMEEVRRIVGKVPVIITTPFGPWEEMSYASDHPRRFHLHHMESNDLCEMFDHHDDFVIQCIAASHSEWGEILGWYVTKFTFAGDQVACYPIDYKRKHREQRPRQTVSFCAIAKNGQYDLPRLLRTVAPVCDEILIGVDETTTDETRRVINDFADDVFKSNRSPMLSVGQFDIPSPVEIGFDAARNLVIDKAKHDWIFWGDADEEFVGAERMPKYLRDNSWRGYGIAQHHFSVEPTAVLSTDFPVRLFRRDPDVRFHGVVHEHPENIHKLNEGVGFAWVNREMHFAHNGYATEAIRRKRFERNISLMARDREENPDRILGMFLWIRDLALMNRFELEQTGGGITPTMQERALIGLELWEKALDDHGDHPQVKRMARDHLEFYDVLVNSMDKGFTFRFKYASGPEVNAPHLDQVPEISARFLNTRHLDKFLSVLINDEVKSYEEKYL
jgi:glycosyltransferase involved in cell wall biosynthesis